MATRGTRVWGGARSRTRTEMTVRSGDFESPASANSAKRARRAVYQTARSERQRRLHQRAGTLYFGELAATVQR